MKSGRDDIVMPLGNSRMSAGLEKGTCGCGEEMMLDLQKGTRSC